MKLDNTPWLHIISQFREHGEAFITGTRAGLESLRDGINIALEHGDGATEVFSTDGEGFGVVIRLSNTVAGLGEPVYFETIARNAYYTEVRLHESIVKDRRRRRKLAPSPMLDGGR